MVRNNSVAICVSKQIPNSDPKFHHPLIVDGDGKLFIYVVFELFLLVVSVY